MKKNILPILLFVFLIFAIFATSKWFEFKKRVGNNLKECSAKYGISENYSADDYIKEHNIPKEEFEKMFSDCLLK